MRVILSDFDGTITAYDITNTMCRRQIPRRWAELEKQWENRQISGVDCYEQEYAALGYSKADIDTFLDNVPVSPGLPILLAAAERLGWQFHILSAGFDYYIERVLGRNGIFVSYTANHISFDASGQPQFRFLELDDPNCRRYRHPCSGCKPVIWQQWKERGYCIAYIGDGATDFCMADYFKKAAQPGDLFFAKLRLLDYCRENKIPCIPYQDLADIAAYLEHNV